MPGIALPASIAVWCVPGFLGLAGLAVVVHGRRVATPLIYGGALAVALAALGAALTCLLLIGPGPAWTVALPIGLPGIGAHLRVDALSAFFLVVVNLGAAVASLYALGYGRHEESPQRVLPFYAAFLAAMNLVVVADDAFTFLMAWELMSLSSWAIVLAHYRDPANSRAAFVYLVMASFGTLCLLLGFGLMAGPAGGYAFDTIRGAALGFPITLLAPLLALVGAGSKAGLVPLHVWLPLAHPAAPSHVSALLSGVMTKVGIYGFIRIVFDLAGLSSPWFGLVVLTLGAITAVVGVLYALMQNDLKRLLAYSTVENVGIIFLGLGLSLAFRANQYGRRGGARHDGGLAARVQPLAVQEPAVLRRRRRGPCDRGARHGTARRVDPQNAADGGGLPGRQRGDCGAAAAQRIRVGMADVPGDSHQPQPAAMGAQADGAGGRSAAGTRRSVCRGLFRQGLRGDVSGPPAELGGGRGDGDRPAVAYRHGRAGGPVFSRRHSAGPADRRTGAGDAAAARLRNAAPGRPALAVDRSDRGEPQFL